MPLASYTHVDQIAPLKNPKHRSTSSLSSELQLLTFYLVLSLGYSKNKSCVLLSITAGATQSETYWHRSTCVLINKITNAFHYEILKSYGSFVYNYVIR